MRRKEHALRPVRCGFVPPHVIDHIARVTGNESAEPSASQRTAVVSKQLREERRREPVELTALPGALTGAPAGALAGDTDRKVYDCEGQWALDVTLVRGEGDPAVTLKSANAAYDNAGATRAFYKDVLNRRSYDHQGSDIVVNVNFGLDFNNAFWYAHHIVLGTGDDVVFTDFSYSPDVFGHELTHGVVEFTANLDYYSQSGALNESFADVFGSLVEQRLRGQDAESANWLIGDEIVAEGLYGEALRSMAHPGTAYDNPIMGQDPQPAHMNDYYTGPFDNQGVHINSGIPNRAFYLTAMEIGTDAAGLIWYAGLQNLWPTANFVDAATVLAAQARILARDNKVDRQAAQTVRAAFREVGVL
jgi:Zn-dependent metalloprotease